MVPAGCDVAKWLVEQVFDQLGSELVLVISQTKLAMRAIAKTVETAFSSEDKGMMSTCTNL